MELTLANILCQNRQVEEAKDMLSAQLPVLEDLWDQVDIATRRSVGSTITETIRTLVRIHRELGDDEAAAEAYRSLEKYSIEPVGPESN